MKRFDLIIIGAALLLALLLLVLLERPKGDAAVAVVYVNDAEYAQLPLDVPTLFTVEQENGRVNVIEIRDGGVLMASSSCHNQLCVQQGHLTMEKAQSAALANWIICLPNGVSIELKEETP
ncbi:MAG: NusG domain II-containing protein [Clostridia bacterium]|nr:NusG domain II-containing protein [Clostridia bacterium]MBQ7113561.1 NusG domain II-containing protein [Clostridia bacterium]